MWVAPFVHLFVFGILLYAYVSIFEGEACIRKAKKNKDVIADEEEEVEEERDQVRMYSRGDTTAQAKVLAPSFLSHGFDVIEGGLARIPKPLSTSQTMMIIPTMEGNMNVSHHDEAAEMEKNKGLWSFREYEHKEGAAEDVSHHDEAAEMDKTDGTWSFSQYKHKDVNKIADEEKPAREAAAKAAEDKAAAKRAADAEADQAAAARKAEEDAAARAEAARLAAREDAILAAEDATSKRVSLDEVADQSAKDADAAKKAADDAEANNAEDAAEKRADQEAAEKKAADDAEAARRAADEEAEKHAALGETEKGAKDEEKKEPLDDDKQEDDDEDLDEDIEEDRVTTASRVSKELGPIVVVVDGLRKVFSNQGISDCCATKEKVVAVRNLSFLVREGEIFGLLGLNGAGKTTAIKMVTREERATAGTVTICGEEGAAGLRHLGYCPQEDVVWDKLTVKEHLTFFATVRGVHKDQIQAHVQRYIEGLRISEHAEVSFSFVTLGCAAILGLKASCHSENVFICRSSRGTVVAER